VTAGSSTAHTNIRAQSPVATRRAPTGRANRLTPTMHGPTTGEAAVPRPTLPPYHAPMLRLHLREDVREPPSQAPAAYKRQEPPSLAREYQSAAGRHYCRQRRASLPLVFPAAQPSRRVTQGPMKLTEPRIASLGRQPTGAANCSGQGKAEPRRPLAGGVSTQTRATSWSYVTPYARSSPSPTHSGEHLAEISPTASPHGSEDRIARPELFSRCFVQTKGITVSIQNFLGAYS
jgi:hypothetical protein